MAEPLEWAPVGHPEGLEVTPEPKPQNLLPANITGAAPSSFRAAQEETGPRQATQEEIWAAAFRQENEVVGALNPVVNFGDEDPNHDPFESIEGTPYEDFWHKFIGSKNQKETDFIIATLQREIQDRQILAAGGYTAFPAPMVAAILSPTTLLPAGAIYKSAKLFGAAAKSATAVGAAAGGATGIQELILQQQQLARTPGESALAIGGSVILGGLLGGAASGIGSAQLARMARAIDEINLAAMGPSSLDPFGQGGLRTMMGDSSAGAAAVIKPAVELESTLGLASVPIIRNQDPVIRTLRNPISTLREGLVELAETVLATTRNRDGIATAPRGGAVETRIKQLGDAPAAGLIRSMDERFAEYYFGRPDVPFRTARATIGEYMKPTGKLTHKQFREEVILATWQHGKHDIPEVAAAAKQVREFFDRHGDTAVEVGNLTAARMARRRGTSASSAAPKEAGGPRVLGPGATPQQKAAVQAIAAIEAALGAPIPDRYFDDLILFMSSGRPEALALTQAVEMLGKVEQLALNLRVIGKQDIPAADLRLIRKVLDGDAKALEEFTARVRNGNAGRQNVSDAEIEALVEQWRFVKSIEKGRQPVSLASFIQSLGGIRDEGGDVLAMLGSHKVRPGFINGKGLEQDEAALRAFEQGYFDERPSVSDFLEVLEGDLRGSQRAYSSRDDALVDDLRVAQQMRTELEQFGVVRETTEEGVRRQLLGRETWYLNRLYQDAKTIVNELGYAEAVKFMSDPAKYRQEVRRAVTNRWRVIEGVIKERGAAREEFDNDTLDQDIEDEIFATRDEAYAPHYHMADRIIRERERFVGILTDHFSESQARAGHVLRRLEQEAASKEAAFMNGAGTPGKAPAKLKKTIDDLTEFTRLSEAELQSIAQEVTRTITAATPGRLYDLPAALRGSLKARTLNVPAMYESPRWGRYSDFLEKDADLLTRVYTRTVVPDNELARRFGSVDMKEFMLKADEEVERLYNDVNSNPDLSDAQKASARQAIHRWHQQGKRDLIAIRDRLRGTYAIPEDPTAILPRIGQSLKTLNFMRLLGGMTVSALTDIPRVMMTQGALTTFRDGVVPLLSNLKATKLAAEEVKQAGTALDMILNTRAMAIADVMEDGGRYSKFERGLGSLRDNFGTLALMNPWNAAMKQWVGMTVMTKILRAAEDVLDGKASAKQVRRLAESGIEADEARLIAEQFRLFGARHGAVRLPNTLEWNTADPFVRNALESFRSAIVRDVDRTVVTPGQDKPLWISTQMGGIIGQFKSFGLATVQRTMMAGLQQRDAGVVVGAMMMIGLGVIVEHLKALTNQKQLPKTDAQWIVTAIDRSGLTGWLFEVNHFAESATGGTVGLSALTGRKVSRYASRNWADSIMGPTGGLAKDLFQGSGGLFRQGLKGEQINESDVRALRRALPYQNLFYLSWLFRELEGASSRALGAKPMKKNSLM